jgi:hypothetical protein
MRHARPPGIISRVASISTAHALRRLKHAGRASQSAPDAWAHVNPDA